MKYERIIKAISETPWMIHPPKLEEIIGVVEARANGVELNGDYFERLQARRNERQGRRGRIERMGVYGSIMQKDFGMMSSFGTSTESFGKRFDAAVADSDVGGILIEYDTPGGSVYGVDELSDRMFAARGSKPIIAAVSPEAFSAGYYLASAADEIWVQPTGAVGSVGVVATHIDASKALEEDGLQYSFVTAGKYKVEGNATEPLADEARAEIQRHVDRYYDMFLSALARNRGVSKDAVESDFGQGRVVGAKDAVRRGMADKVGTIEEAESALQKRIGRGSRASMARRRLNIAKAS